MVHTHIHLVRPVIANSAVECNFTPDRNGSAMRPETPDIHDRRFGSNKLLGNIRHIVTGDKDKI